MIAKHIALSSTVSFYPEHSCLKVTGGEDIYLSPSEKKLLEIVLDGKGSKENILQQIWLNNGTIVGESSYHQLVKMLRRKLQKANLPCTVIKTLPRFGIIYLRPEEAQETDGGAAGTLVAVSADHQQAETDLLPDDAVLPSTGLTVVNARQRRLFSPLVIPAALLLFLPVLGLMFWQPQAENFPLERDIAGVLIHANRSQLLSSEVLEKLVGTPDKSLRHIYIAGNGPRIWIARCKNEIVKVKNQCQYQNLSLY